MEKQEIKGCSLIFNENKNYFSLFFINFLHYFITFVDFFLQLHT